MRTSHGDFGSLPCFCSLYLSWNPCDSSMDFLHVMLGRVPPWSCLGPKGLSFHHMKTKTIIISEICVLPPAKSSTSITLATPGFISICTTHWCVSCGTYLVKCLLLKVSEGPLVIGAEYNLLSNSWKKEENSQVRYLHSPIQFSEIFTLNSVSVPPISVLLDIAWGLKFAHLLLQCFPA